MRLERLVLTGFSSAFPGVVDLRLRDLEPGIVAVTGPNGAGKTTLLEAVPAALYRKLPSRNGADPVGYAMGRESSIVVEFTSERDAGLGVFSARLNLDGPKRNTDAILELVLSDGTRAKLNDGKRSTYDQAIAERFPSFDLFINSTFAAQGRGDEFTRRKPSQRKDLFVEFLGLAHYATLAATAAEAADLVGDARLRLEVQLEALQRDTAAPILEALSQTALDLQKTGGWAELRKRDLQGTLADLETRLAVVRDTVGAYAAATQRIRTLESERAARQAERASLDAQRTTALVTWDQAAARIQEKRDADIASLKGRIEGNQKIIGMADAIRAAVKATEAAGVEIAALRTELDARQNDRMAADVVVRDVERAIAALVPVERDLARAQTDANLLLDVPCGGDGAYAACRFLVNAKAAEGQIGTLSSQVRQKAGLADQLAAALQVQDQTVRDVIDLTDRIKTIETAVGQHSGFTKYALPLAEATVKIAGYEAAIAKAETDATEQLDEAEARYVDRVKHLDEAGGTLDATLARLDADLTAARADLDTTAEGNDQARALQAELAAARAEWDQVTTTLATVAHGRQELERRRADIDSKRTRLATVRAHLARVQQDLVDWRDLVKGLSKGGLPDLEIDAAGPSITALTNSLLQACFGPRFTVELVTQVEKVGGGMKDEFTVKVFDNEAGGEWRDISDLSGGEKTIVQEALMSAIALYVNQRSPMPIRTLWRDETGAALDPVNALRYVQMLRKVRELGGYVHVFFISHNPEAAAHADAQIVVGEGTARIVLKPYTEAA